VNHGEDSYTSLPKPIDSGQELRVGMLFELYKKFLAIVGEIDVDYLNVNYNHGAALKMLFSCLTELFLFLVTR